MSNFSASRNDSLRNNKLFCIYYLFQYIIQSILYIKATQGNLKMYPLLAVALYTQDKISFLKSDLLYRGDQNTELDFKI